MDNGMATLRHKGVILAYLSVASTSGKSQKTLPKIRFQTEEDVKKQDEYMKSIGCEPGWMTPKQSEVFKKSFPCIIAIWVEMFWKQYYTMDSRRNCPHQCL
jgi:hypothetical protein